MEIFKMKTGKYRVREGLFGKAVLQYQFDGPSFSGGQVDSSIRVLYWSDVPYSQAPTALKEAKDD